MENTVVCSVCNKEVVFSEFVGWRHRSKEYPFGIPKAEDKSGHKVRDVRGK